MTKYKISLENIKNIQCLNAEFDFSDTRIITITGKNGSGKSSLVQAFSLFSDIQIFERISAKSSIKENSEISISIDNETFKYKYNSSTKSLDIREKIPKNSIITELPIPYGTRFKQFPLISQYDSDIRAQIAGSNYNTATNLIKFLSSFYCNKPEIEKIKETKIKNKYFYFILLDSDYYLREDHFSSGEFFLIHLYRLISSNKLKNPKLLVVDETEISFDASAQVNFIKAIEPILEEYNINLLIVSHSLSLIENSKEGTIYYQEFNNKKHSLVKRSIGYIKSDLFALKGKDRYIITEDKTLSGFIKHVIKSEKLDDFFEVEIIEAGGEPQIINLACKNKESEIFAPESRTLVIVDGDIFPKVEEKLNNSTNTKVIKSPVDDIELFLWGKRDLLLKDVHLESFKEAKKEKVTAKTFWKKTITSKQKTEKELYDLIKANSPKEELNLFIQGIKDLLSPK